MKKSRGTAMLILLVVLTTAGVVAGKVLPSFETQAKNRNEGETRTNLSQIRAAFDLKRLKDPGFPLAGLGTRAKINAALKTLQEEGYLSNASITDSTVQGFRWDTDDSLFWKATGNISSNTSFESTTPPDPALSEIVSSWSFGTLDTFAATDTKFFPSKNSNVFDDYEGQNKLGSFFSASGSSLKLTK